MANTTIKRRGVDGIKKVSSLPLFLLLFIPHFFLLILISLLDANEDDNGSDVGRFVEVKDDSIQIMTLVEFSRFRT